MVQQDQCFTVAIDETLDLDKFTLIKVGNKTSLIKYADAAIIYRALVNNFDDILAFPSFAVVSVIFKVILE
jgi:hypothetical protein